MFALCRTVTVDGIYSGLVGAPPTLYLYGTSTLNRNSIAQELVYVKRAPPDKIFVVNYGSS
jgi:hypothetical protein